MSAKPLNAIGSVSGGPVKCSPDPGRARNIHVTILNTTAATHGAFFGRSRREVESLPNQGFPGFCVIAVANNVVTSTIGTVAYTSFILQGWTGELWAAADADGVLTVDIMDAGTVEK